MTPSRPFLVGRFRGCRWWHALLVAACLAGALPAQQRSREYDLKAVFLFNFATFVEWPEAARPPANEPLVIGILGRDPFGPALDEIVAGEKLNGHPLQVRRCRTPDEARGCHILFISASEAPRATEILEALKGQPVLTVGDMPRFLEMGGVIAFSTDARLQLHVNAPAARQAGLSISSKLLRVATVVGDIGPP
jgi:hypothetical protein